jgi:hypothetical protein
MPGLKKKKSKYHFNNFGRILSCPRHGPNAFFSEPNKLLRASEAEWSSSAHGRRREQKTSMNLAAASL